MDKLITGWVIDSAGAGCVFFRVKRDDVALLSIFELIADRGLIKCAKEEGIPCRGIWGKPTAHPKKLPAQLKGVRVVNWKWANIDRWMNSL